MVPTLPAIYKEEWMRQFRIDASFIEKQLTVQLVRNHLWKLMINGKEPSWLNDVSSTTAMKLFELTMASRRERRAHEENWRWLLSERLRVS